MNSTEFLKMAGVLAEIIGSSENVEADTGRGYAEFDCEIYEDLFDNIDTQLDELRAICERNDIPLEIYFADGTWINIIFGKME